MGRKGGNAPSKVAHYASRPANLVPQMRRRHHELVLQSGRLPFSRTSAMLVPFWKVLLRRQAAQVPDLLQLLLVRVALDDRPLVDHLAEDAAERIKSNYQLQLQAPAKSEYATELRNSPDTPDVDTRAVLLEAEEELRRSVPACDDHVGVLWGFGLRIRPRQPTQDCPR